jgi:hypothetical protein
MMRTIGVIVLILVLLVAAVFLIGSLLPVAHTAIVRADYGATPADVLNAIADVESSPTWRDDIDSVTVLERDPLRWRETGKFGDLTFEREAYDPERRIVARIADTSQGFGGTWTYRVEPAATGTTLTITENGEVYNALFRFMSKFVFSHYSTLETYVTSLGRRLGQDVTPVRVTSQD